MGANRVNRVTSAEIESAESDLDELYCKYLRQHGWNRTCEAPGGIWLWKRQLPGGVLLMVDRPSAIRICEYEDMVAYQRLGHEPGEDGVCIVCAESLETIAKGGFQLKCTKTVTDVTTA